MTKKFVGIKDWDKIKAAQALNFIKEFDEYVKEKDNYTLDEVYKEVLSNCVEVIKRDLAESVEKIKILTRKYTKVEDSLLTLVDKVTKKDYRDILKKLLED